MDYRPADNPVERGPGARRIPSLLGVEDACEHGDSSEYSQGNAFKGRIIVGADMTAPV